MKMLVFCDNYPRPGPGYADSFVRVRLESYLRSLDADIVVVKLRRMPTDEENYVFNGVKVQLHTRESLPVLLKTFQPDVMLAHFIQAYLCRTLPALTDAPLLTWVHGEEALSWTRRIFYLRTLGIKGFLKYVASNTVQRHQMAKLFRRANCSEGRSQFIFVSEWMRRIAEADVGVRLKHCNIIPNFVDNNFFQQVPKCPGDNRKILLIRSFNSAKYANDIAIAAIEKLSRDYKGFERLQFTIVGEGKLWDELTARIRFHNVTLINRSLDHEEIRSLHASHGVFLCPTRQDAQGVSMCEAMSSGLVPVASDNTAIPEFLSKHEGYLCKSVSEVAAAMAELADNDILFIEKATAAARAIRARTGYEGTIDKEIRLIKSVVAPAMATARLLA
jgi:glycosyltransferase involved in cell wall biosynthesis